MQPNDPPGAKPPSLPIFPEALAEASPRSLSELGMLSPEEMSEEEELAFIQALREQRERFARVEEAKPRKGGKPPRQLQVITGPGGPTEF